MDNKYMAIQLRVAKQEIKMLRRLLVVSSLCFSLIIFAIKMGG